MIPVRTLTLGIVAILSLLLLSFQVVLAVPCDNSRAESVIPKNNGGQPLTPQEIQASPKILEGLKRGRLVEQHIERCLMRDAPLINHVIDFGRYVAAWKEINDPQRRLSIKDSVLWSFETEGLVDLTAVANNKEKLDRQDIYIVAAPIEWMNVHVGPSVSAMNAILFADTKFQGVVFGDGASFENASFGDEVSFKDAKFGDRTSFRGADFGDEASFENASFGDEIFFDWTVFGHHPYFASATFGGNASFFDAKFGNHTTFARSSFSGDAIFASTEFRGDAYFPFTDIGGAISFRSATFNGGLRIRDADWKGDVDFQESEIANLVWDNRIRSSIKGIFDAQKAKFKSVLLQDVYFFDLVNFSDAELGEVGKVVFEYALFEKTVDFLRTKFWSDGIFVQNRFHGVWDLTRVTFARDKAHLCLSFNRINRLVMGREHLYDAKPGEVLQRWLRFSPLTRSRIRSVEAKNNGNDDEERRARERKTYSCVDFSEHVQNEWIHREEHEGLDEVYRTVESSFRQANDKWGENEAWYLGRVADRKRKGTLIGLFFATFLDFPSRHGIDLIRVCLVSVGIMIFFSIIYGSYFKTLTRRRQVGLIRLAPSPDHRRKLQFRFFERFIVSEERLTRPVRPLKDAMLLSGRAFTQLGQGSIYWAVGMYMLIHFLLAVKNTLPIALPFLSG